MKKTTPREAFRVLVKSGALVGKQAEILDALTDDGPATSGEILNRMRVANVNAWRARFTELQARGLIREMTQRPCSVSGRTCVVWAATNRTKPLDRRRGNKGRGGVKAWRALAMDLWGDVKNADILGDGGILEYEERVRALGGKP